jgi:hypothetical protein
LDRNTQEVMQLAQILHREFLLQGGDHATKKLSAGRGEDNIIHVEKEINCI